MSDTPPAPLPTPDNPSPSHVLTPADFAPGIDMDPTVGMMVFIAGNGLIQVDGKWAIDPAFVQALIPAPEGGGTDTHVTALGFDEQSEMLTLNKSDGDPVMGQLTGVVTKTFLQTNGSVQPVSAFGRPVTGFKGLPA